MRYVCRTINWSRGEVGQSIYLELGSLQGRSSRLCEYSIISPDQILMIREQHGGEEAMKLVSYKKDDAVIKICKSWAGDYDSTEVQSLGFEVDDKETGYSGAVEDFKQVLLSQKQ